MKSKKASSSLQNKFSETIHKIGHRFSLGKVFDDFLTMTMCAVTPNPVSYTHLDVYKRQVLPSK